MANAVRLGAFLGVIGAAIVATPEASSFFHSFLERVEERSRLEALTE